jgi:hypothetical protein
MPKMSCLSSLLLQEQPNQFPCSDCSLYFFVRQSFQNVSNLLSNTPQHRKVVRQIRKVRRLRIYFRILKEELGALRLTGFERTRFMYS